ncbi:hypothetical protein [Enterococcus gilvus]|uniref:hypothetical protein n=1 Tax=Enterococcus gilvus TaxID=160453 RepID=UPI001C8B6E27|nr:hypothetical protein [Enterococcus gilvus]MBX8938845.1 hypothetical protein [Enterococcus gilvus]
MKTYFGRSKKRIQERQKTKKKYEPQDKVTIISSIIPVVISIISSVYINVESIKSQEKISTTNAKIQQEQVNLNNTNSYPAFDFEEKKLNDGTTQYTLNKTKGEMNNVSFSVFEIIEGQGIYNGTPVYIKQTLLSSQRDLKENKDSFSYVYKYNYDFYKLSEQFESICKKENLNFTLNNFTINRYYNVSYMNFEHVFKDEFYTVGTHGIGQAIESPHEPSTTESDDAIYISVSLGTGNSDYYSDNSWLAQNIYEFVSARVKS